MAAGIFLPHEEVGRGEARDLRKMRHADDLIDRRELLQLASDDLRDATADTGIDLVEHQSCLSRSLGCLEKRGGDRELDARQLAAGRNPLHRLRFLSFIRSDQNLDVIRPGFAVLRLFDRHSHCRSFHCQVAQFALNGRLECAGCFVARGRQFFGIALVRSSSFLFDFLKPVDARLEVAERVVFLFAVGEMLQRNVGRAAILFLEPLDRGEALFDRLESRRIVSHGFTQRSE
ncbi:MAG: hypothetical protein DMF59_05400 [Acidobacteria bacterium]|nr:MAG: hypothetical protein DMF59_05400 [Acidobacteriota bacterium]